jgi:hypothetical protein
MNTPLSKNIGLEGYEADPFFPVQFVVEDSQKAVANALVPLWLTRFTSPRAIPSVRLEAYEINGIEVGEWEKNRFIALANFSVKPLNSSYDEWLIGKGEETEGWIQDIVLSFTIVKQEENYRIVGIDVVA